MKLPTQRITFNLAEYHLIKPGLDKLANGFANAKLGTLPHRHPWHLIDLVASDVYADRDYDADMAGRVMSVRSKLWDLAQSRKIRLDPFELAAAAFATRISGDHEASRNEIARSPEMKRLRSKLEKYRRRGMRAAIDKVGKVAYQDAADQWVKFVFWCRFNLLYFKMPSPARSSWWAAKWREQRIQLSGIITKLLEKRFCENLDDQQMRRTITLATTTLRRCRRSFGLRDLLRDPDSHEDFLFEFVSKRNDLKKLPGSPVPAWQASMDRTAKFDAYLAAKKARLAATVVTIPAATVPVATVPAPTAWRLRLARIRALKLAAENVETIVVPPGNVTDRTDKVDGYLAAEKTNPIAKSTVAAVPVQTALGRRLAIIGAPKPLVAEVETIVKPPVNTHNGVALTAEILCDAIAEWLAEDFGSRPSLIQGICHRAQSMISGNLLDRYRGPTVSTSFEGLLQELRPKDPVTDANSIIPEYAGWLLRVLLALRQQPDWMLWAIGTARARAMGLIPPASYATRIG
jgi:hypothetical protein